MVIPSVLAVWAIVERWAEYEGSEFHRQPTAQEARVDVSAVVGPADCSPGRPYLDRPSVTTSIPSTCVPPSPCAATSTVHGAPTPDLVATTTWGFPSNSPR